MEIAENGGDADTQEEHDNQVHPAQHVVRQAHDELRQLLQQRTDVVRRIGTVKKTIAGLAALFGESVMSDGVQEMINPRPHGRRAGLTRTCRALLMEADRPLTARELCERLQARDADLLVRNKDPLAAVTTILNRLAAYGETQRVSGGWKWVEEPPSKE